MTDPETELRALWTAKGVPVDRHDELVREIGAKAAPGAWVGPWQIPHDIKGATQRGADAPLLATVNQRPLDFGLFGDDAQQTDLVDMARKR